MIFRHFAHFGNEAVAPARDRHDVAMVVWRLAQRLAERGNVSIEVSFLDHGVWPDALHELFFDQDLTRVFHKSQENFKALRSERQGLAVS